MTSYLLKIGSRLRLVPLKEFDTLEAAEIMPIALEAIQEQKKQMMIDAYQGKIKLFYGRKVVEALEESISKLEERVPNVRSQINRMVCGHYDLH